MLSTSPHFSRSKSCLPGPMSGRKLGIRTATAVVFAMILSASAWGQHNVLTQRGDVQRDGQISDEIYLTPSNVNSNQFGSVFSYSVDGYIAAQPLYVSGVNIAGVGTVNVVYVTTTHDSVYAFNADMGTGAPLWQVSFLNSGNGTTVTTEPVSALGCGSVNGY